jgi:hypothetical protein
LREFAYNHQLLSGARFGFKDFNSPWAFYFPVAVAQALRFIYGQPFLRFPTLKDTVYFKFKAADAERKSAKQAVRWLMPAGLPLLSYNSQTSLRMKRPPTPKIILGE